MPRASGISTWISEIGRFPRQAAVAALVLLTACDAAGLFGAPPDRAVVADGSMVIAGPSGYCVDTSSRRRTPQGEFVLLGSCASIAGNGSYAAPVVPAVLTASISAEGAANIGRAMDRLEEFFRSPKGRAALARDGKAGSVRILGTSQRNGAFVLRVLDKSPGKASGLDDEYWRALFDLNGRIVTVSIIEFAEKPMDDDEALATLMTFIGRIRQETQVAGGGA